MTEQCNTKIGDLQCLGVVGHPPPCQFMHNSHAAINELLVEREAQRAVLKEAIDRAEKAERELEIAIGMENRAADQAFEAKERSAALERAICSLFVALPSGCTGARVLNAISDAELVLGKTFKEVTGDDP